MKQTVKLSIAAVVIMFFIIGSVTAQNQSKSAESNHKMMKNMQMNCDSTMMKNHKDMMKDGKMSCDSTMMKDMQSKCDGKMMKDMQSKCDSKMMKDHKNMMKDGKMMCDSSKMMDHKGMMKANNGMMDHNKMMKQTNMKKNHVVRTGIIDVSEIDKNKDGKVYQDVMDWNVISDNPGECPLCGMKLKEVTVEQAVKNLEKNGFKTK